MAGTPPQRIRVGGLNAGESREFTFDHTYVTTGEVQSVAIVDTAHELSETNESNNSTTLTFNVRPYQRQLVAATTNPVKLFESYLDVDKGIDVVAGDRLIVRASGKINPGFFAQPDCGPEGYTWALADKETFPLTGVAKFCLLYKVNGSYHFVGQLHDAEITDTARLYLRINDDVPNNGSKKDKEKFYSCDIEVWR
jgi:hypothetical protein